MIDLRGSSAFATGHPLGALNLAFGQKVGYYAGYVLPHDARVVLLAANQPEATEAGRQLLRVGVSRIDGYVNGGFEAWRDAGLPASAFPLTNVQDLQGTLGGSNPPVIVDVRTTREWNAGHIDEAVHIPLGDLARRASELPRDRNVATICEGGYRSSLAASVLARSGLDRVINVTGGMAAWRALQPAG
jgi:hydroxyacylglutathione hydrolase